MFRWDKLMEYMPLFLQGVVVTIEITVISVLLGTILGLFAGMWRLSDSRILRGIASVYVGLFRGTPLFVQILLIHFAVLPTFMETTAFVSGIVALSLNAGAYIAEIFRAGIQSIDRGQMEAARSLGMTKGQTMREVILPQAFRRMLPPLGNEAIMLLKDSSLLAAISLPEVTYYAKLMQGKTYLAWEPFLTLMLMYLVLTMVLARVVSFLERKYGTV
ncbi:amino acid ABC transporter membrane protein (PAAT family) [Tumebacillus sp. BK434]|uniref:amino acid ABC transporter permease n=1 Tax=Tumebacillus sp. BK434 TaxID=2512169 RepID=UPI00104CC0EF|nr:amino acid ABC transporter permease [Tumebacillus sp. BK434]TCP52248.1 amino acid ABC transporter membrane protein (PAAT family) [Tumebacillus sp. BK434]